MQECCEIYVILIHHKEPLQEEGKAFDDYFKPFLVFLICSNRCSQQGREGFLIYC